MTEVTQEWKRVNQYIEASKITRIDWKDIFGKSLTHLILEYKFSGLSSSEIYALIKNSQEMQDYLNIQNTSWSTKVLANLWNSINSRVAESNTELKILNEGRV